MPADRAALIRGSDAGDDRESALDELEVTLDHSLEAREVPVLDEARHFLELGERGDCLDDAADAGNVSQDLRGEVHRVSDEATAGEQGIAEIARAVDAGPHGSDHVADEVLGV